MFLGNKVLITGGLGFVGSNLAHKLVELGATVTLYDNLLTGCGGNWANVKEIKNDIEVVIGDIRDYDKLKSYVKEADIVYHCAAQPSRVVSMSDPELDVAINLQGTINVLEAAAKSKKKKNVKVVYTSSRAVTGIPKQLPADEQTVSNPVDIYGANKFTAELYCKIYNRAYGLKTVILRLNNCYGPRAQLRTPSYGVINLFIRNALEDGTLSVYKPGTMLRDYNYVEDVVRALILSSISEEAIGETFYLGSGKPISLIDSANLITRIAGGGTVKLTHSPKNWASIEIGDFYASYAKIKEKLSWAPEVNIERGLEKTISFYREHLKEYL